MCSGNLYAISWEIIHETTKEKKKKNISTRTDHFERFGVWERLYHPIFALDTADCNGVDKVMIPLDLSVITALGGTFSAIIALSWTMLNGAYNRK